MNNDDDVDDDDRLAVKSAAHLNEWHKFCLFRNIDGGAVVLRILSRF